MMQQIIPLQENHSPNLKGITTTNNNNNTDIYTSTDINTNTGINNINTIRIINFDFVLLFGC